MVIENKKVRKIAISQLISENIKGNLQMLSIVAPDGIKEARGILGVLKIVDAVVSPFCV